MTRMFRAKSDVQTSTLNKSATDSIGSRAKGFLALDRTFTLAGGDETVATTTISQTSATLLKDGTLQLTSVAENAAGDVLADIIPTWSSDDETVATVDSTGLVSVVGAGTCNIKATASAVDSSNCAITVTAILTAFTLTPATLNFAHTTTGTTTLAAQDQFGNDMALPGSITITSSDETKATAALASTTVTVTGVAAGTTNVTASKSGVTSNVCAVTCT